MKSRVLFVDGRPDELEGLRRGLDGDSDWDMRIAETGKQALEHLARNPCDVIVTDARIPDMNGEDFLSAVMEDYPGTVRMIMSAEVDRDLDLRPGSIHQIVSRECDSDEFRKAVARALKLHGLIQDPELKRVIAQITRLPSLPSLYMRIVEEMHSKDPSIRRVGEIVARDVAMTSKVLQISNSVAFGARVKLADPVQATIYLGLNMIKGLVLTVKVFSRFKESMLSVFPLKELWDHSFRIGNCARIIAKMENLDRSEVDQAFTGGLLHDVGQLVLATNLTDDYCNILDLARQNELPLWQVELETFGATHSQVGAYLIGLWGLDDSIFDVLLYHHTADIHPNDQFSTISAVYMANLIDRFPDLSSRSDAESEQTRMYLERMGKSDRLEEWCNACSECKLELTS